MRLRTHPLIGFEEGPGECDQRAIAWVIEGFNAGNPLGKMRLSSLDIGQELSLGICWTRDQYRTGLRDGLSHAFAQLLVERHMATITGIRLVMNMLVRMGTANGRAIDLRRVVLFALPGAYTPTCSTGHVPRFVELAPELRKHGVADIVCLSVNDPFVMDAWQREQNAGDLTFLPNAEASFTAAMGMLVDKGEVGLGKRSWRYSMLVNDARIEKMFIEPDKPGDPFEISDADTMLAYLDTSRRMGAVMMFARPGCPFCARAEKLLEAHHIPCERIDLGHGVRALRAGVSCVCTSGSYGLSKRVSTAAGCKCRIAAWAVDCDNPVLVAILCRLTETASRRVRPEEGMRVARALTLNSALFARGGNGRYPLAYCVSDSNDRNAHRAPQKLLSQVRRDCH